MATDVVSEIEKLRPHHLLVTVEGEAEPRRVAVPKRRNRWAAIARVLDALAWTEIACCDGQGGVLAILKAEDTAPVASTAIAATATAADQGVTIREAQLCDLIVAVARETTRSILDVQRETREATEAVNRELRGALADGLRTLGELQRLQVGLFQRALADAATGGEGDLVEALAPLVGAVLEKKDAKGKPANRPAAPRVAPSKG